jgi:hypothetical protein
MATTRPLAGSLCILALLGAACGVGGDRPLACEVDETCGPAARCLGGACVADAPPEPDFQLPAAATTHREITLVASASDPDPDDRVIGWSWSVEAGPGACPPDLGPLDGPSLELVAWCPGNYRVSLVATDALGLASAPRLRTLTVAMADLPPEATAGPARSAGHRCAGTPLRCVLEAAGTGEEVPLQGAGSSPGGGAVAYEWTALPPAGRSGAAVVFSPGPTAASPSVRIETDGGPISGDWMLRLRVRDQAGLVAQALQPLTVGNRAPALSATSLGAPHAHDGTAFRIRSSLPLPVSDPDGDPLAVTARLVEPVGSGCQSTAVATAAAIDLDVACPAAAGLLGRSLAVEAVDANGAGASALLPIEVANRPPEVALGSTLDVDHLVGPCPSGAGSCFLAAGAAALQVSDPDGDPVELVGASALVSGVRPGSEGEISSASPELAWRFSTPIDRPADFRGPDGTGGFSVSVEVADPFGATAAATAAIRVGNRPPDWTASASPVTAGHAYEPASGAWTASALLGTLVDPDGDPVVDAGSLGDTDCSGLRFEDGQVSVSCRRPWDVALGGVPPLAGFPGSHHLTVLGSDGWATAGQVVALSLTNQAPVVPALDGQVESCLCACSKLDPLGECIGTWRWVTDLAYVPLPVTPLDADGDPLQATFTSAATLSSTGGTALPGGHAVTLVGPVFPVAIEVAASDGAASASGTWTVTGAVCARSGGACPAP